MSAPRQSQEAWITRHSWSLWNLLEERPKMILNPEYQRSSVWRGKRPKLLIDSILRGWDIGLFLFNGILIPRENGSTLPKYEVIDGQQRIRTIYDFFDGHLAISGESPDFTISGAVYDLRDKKWTDEDFPPAVRPSFHAYIIKTQVYIQKDEQEVARIFARVQDGLRLNNAERTNAIIGYIRNNIKDISGHTLLQNSRVKLIRFNRRWITANCVYREITEFVNGNFLDANLKNMKEMYNDNIRRTNIARSALAQVKRIYSYLDTQLGVRADLISKNSDFITIYMVASYLKQNDFIIDGDVINWIEFIENFIIKVGEARRMMRDTGVVSEELQQYYNYYRNMGRENGVSAKNRFDIVMEKLIALFPNVERRNSQRLFDDYQKRIIAKNANYQCQEPQDSGCSSTDVGLADGEADHIIPWIEKGPTSIENGQWLCQHCNRVKGAR